MTTRAMGVDLTFHHHTAVFIPAPATAALDSETIADLNDLLQLDRDALTVYDLAMRELERDSFRDSVRTFRRDHERHVDELTALIRKYGGLPLTMPHPSSVDKLALQAVGDLGGGDAHVLVAFRNNERQSRDKYLRAAQRTVWPADVMAVIQTAASDEERHYAWVDRTVRSLGVTDDRA
ncbi:MAG TPA: DUF2383 domain-containing protein, partial [Gemmatirosa sp.]